MPRPARRRGGDGAAAGVSSDKVSVLTMVNARGDAMAVAACRGKMGVADARRAMAGCALEGAVVSTDRQRGYVRALAEMGVAAHERFASSGPRGSLDGLVGAVCLAFELELPVSRKALGDRGYLQALLREPFGLSPLFESELTQYRWDAICDVMGRFHVC